MPGDRVERAERNGEVRRRRTPKELRSHILKVAFRTFSLHGFEGTRLRDIAVAANSSEQLILYHFDSKAQLWEASVEAAMAERFAEIESIDASEALSATAKLRQLIALEVNLMAELPELYRIIVLETYPGSDRAKWFNEHYGHKGFQAMCRVITAAQEEGTTRRIAPERLRYAIQGAAIIHSTSSGYRELTGGDSSSREEINATIDFINRMVFFDG